MKHLVLGGSGFLGRHVIRALLKDDQIVKVAGRSAYPAGAEKHASEFCPFDVITATDDDYDRLIDGCDIIHHYLWTTIPQTANADPVHDLSNNVVPTVRLLEAMRRRGGGRIIFSSSGGTVYGKLNTIPVPETHVLSPITAYGASKLSAETYMNFYHELYGIDTRIARIANPFGAGQNLRKAQGVISALIGRAINGETIEIWGDGEVVRDFLYISDAVSGLLRIANADRNSIRGPFIYNLASGKGSSINELVASIESCLGSHLDVVRRPARAFDVPVSVLDISKIYKDLNWKPKISLELGIQFEIEDLQRDNQTLFASQF